MAGYARPKDASDERLPQILPILGLLLWFVAGYFLTTQLPVRGFPYLSRTDFRLSIDWNEPLPIPAHSTRVRALNHDFRATFPESSTAAFVGEDRFLLSAENRAINAAELHFYLPQSPTKGFLDSLLQAWQTRHPEASFQLAPIANLFDRIFLTDEPYLALRLRRADGRETPDWGAVQPMVNALQNAGLSPVLPARQEAISLEINYEQLWVSQVSSAVLRDRLLTLFNENEVTSLRTNDQSLPVLIASSDQLTANRLLTATVTNQRGKEIPLRYLIQSTRVPEYRVLSADRSGEYLPLILSGEPDDVFIAKVRQLVLEYPQFTAQLTGRFSSDKGRVAELGGVLLVSLLLLYLILAAQFEGLRLPFVVLLVVPVSLVGSLIALWLTNGSLNLLSLIGMVVTGGIVVNDAIIKVDMIERARLAGMDITAAIKEASRRRLRAIVMTSLTTVLALAPVLFTSGLGAELQQPLAITIIGGLLVGTLGSLYVVPVLYRLLSSGHAEARGTGG